MHPHRSGVLSFLAKPFLILLLLVGIFGMVRLRSGIMSVEYEIGSLEQQMMEAANDAQLLKAELASLLSIKQVDARRISLDFPDRKRVIYVKRDEGGAPYRASLNRGER